MCAFRLTLLLHVWAVSMALAPRRSLAACTPTACGAGTYPLRSCAVNAATDCQSVDEVLDIGAGRSAPALTTTAHGGVVADFAVWDVGVPCATAVMGTCSSDNDSVPLVFAGNPQCNETLRLNAIDAVSACRIKHG